MKQRIAILGGGVSSMTTAYLLTEEEGWQDKYDITIYQMGWRLGGKGASGRNRKMYDRIEEHGLHLWFGFYDNAFNLMQRCYQENNRPAGAPLATWEQAFKPHSLIVLEEFVWGNWKHLPIELPTNNEVPGQNKQLPGIWEYVKHILAFARDRHIILSGKLKDVLPQQATEEHHGLMDFIHHFWQSAGKKIEAIELDLIGKMILGALEILDWMDRNDPDHQDRFAKFLHNILLLAWRHLEKHIDANTDARHLWVALDFSMTTIKGMIRDGVVTKGYDVINDMDYREWMTKHGLSPITADSALVQAVYGLVFGGYKFFSFEAGTALRGLFRMSFTYRGAVYYRMQAGMGDTIFAPMYEVLSRRGVKFEFFHKVSKLNLTADGKSIDNIEIEVQATVKGGGEYKPLYNVKGLPCWPSDPIYEQLNEGAVIEAGNYNLESYWSPWKGPDPDRPKVLKAGKDFDKVVLGLSIGALPVVAKDLISKDSRWKNMVDKVTPCMTQAFQLWFYPNVKDMGWEYYDADLALSGSYKEPMDTWADMSQLLIRESWPADNNPLNVAYVCGPVQEPVDYSKWDFSDTGYPERAYEKVKQATREYLEQLSAHLWTKTTKPEGGFNYKLLADPDPNAKDDVRYNNQWFRANIDPTELYVLSTTGSSKYRIKTDQSGFSNLLITGDWIDNGFNAGCVEAAVMAGMQTARAVSGRQIDIPGEKDIL